ncbi:hypothetical protein PRIPAC_88219, partial [Pristionchus pacificus]|uniref:Uncharacterized protein n=1 Tax=Pristionchus pacificus TaxID=54126 RepID=A0A2A6CUY3_PRIPA
NYFTRRLYMRCHKSTWENMPRAAHRNAQLGITSLEKRREEIDLKAATNFVTRGTRNNFSSKCDNLLRGKYKISKQKPRHFCYYFTRHGINSTNSVSSSNYRQHSFFPRAARPVVKSGILTTRFFHSCARDGRSTLTLALFHPQFGESSSVSLGNPTSIAHLDHLEEDQGRILIASCDLRSRKAPFKKTTSLRRLDDLLLDSNHRLSATGHRQQKAKKISLLTLLILSAKIPIPSLTMFLPAGPVP